MDDSIDLAPSLDDIRDAFVEELGNLGGQLHDTCVHEGRLYARGVLPHFAEILPSDHVQAGIAVRVEGPSIAVHPYTLRKVCVNGAVHARTLDTQLILRTQHEATEIGRILVANESEALLDSMREHVRACGSAELFGKAAERMRDSARTRMMNVLANEQMDYILTLLELFPDFARRARAEHRVPLVRILRRMAGLSRWEIGNQITAMARETQQPELRWDLERMGAFLFDVAGSAPRSNRVPSDTFDALVS